jgi:DNA repair protein RadC
MTADEKPEHGHRQRLKERWLSAGYTAFSERDRLEFLLTFALPRKDTKPIAQELLKTFGSLQRIGELEIEVLKNFPGLGEHSALLLSLVGHFNKKPPRQLKGCIVKGPTDVEDYLLRELGLCAEEKVLILLLDQANRILDAIELEHGIENRANVYIKKAVRAAFDRHATGLICVHNHPSGRGDFSPQDLTLTKELDQALRPLEIRLLDHFLVAGDEVVSMREKGLYFK